MDKILKICHVSCLHPQEDIRIFHKECCSLARCGYDVSLIQQGDSYVKNGVKITGYGQKSSKRISQIFVDMKKVSAIALKTDADLFHIHEPYFLPLALRLKARGKKVVFDSHERYAEQIKIRPYLNKPIRNIVSFVYQITEKIVLKKIDGVIFPCTKDGVNPFENRCKRAVILNNVPMLSELYTKYIDLQDKADKREKYVCYIGSLTRERGVTNAIKAVYSAGCKLLLCGRFVSEEYQKEVEQMPEYSCVEYMGVLNREQVCSVIQKSDIGLANILNIGQYNQYDNFATKVYEYMSLGVPVILSQSKYNSEMTRKFEFGLCVDPDDVHGIAEAIMQLIKDPDLCTKMGNNGRKAIYSFFNWEKEVETLYSLYDDIGQEMQCE